MIVDKSGSTIFLEKYQYPFVEISKTFIYGNDMPIYLITVNNWTGAGRETGHLTYFAEIREGKFNYVISKDGLQSSLGSHWIISNYKKEITKQIFFIESTYSTDPIELILKRYYFDGKDWNCKEKRIKGEWWEQGEKNFPSLDLFP